MIRQTKLWRHVLETNHGRHVRANGIRQHYLHFQGSGRRILIIPGIVTPAILWRHVGHFLSATHDCYALDVRGRGLSESGAHLDYGFDACAQDLIAFVRVTGLAPLTVLGHSMGARIALRAASEAPALFESIILVDPPTSGAGRRPYPVPKARTLALLRAAHRGEPAAAQNNNTSPWPEDLRDLRSEWLPTCDERAVHVAYDDFHGPRDLFEDLARTSSPVALICAGKGDVVSEADVDEMRRIRPDLQAVRLPDAGHQMQAENFAEFSRELGKVLRWHDAELKRGNS
jgi:N-formylmaleamate deformylase